MTPTELAAMSPSDAAKLIREQNDPNRNMAYDTYVRMDELWKAATILAEDHAARTPVVPDEVLEAAEEIIGLAKRAKAGERFTFHPDLLTAQAELMARFVLSPGGTTA